MSAGCWCCGLRGSRHRVQRLIQPLWLRTTTSGSAARHARSRPVTDFSTKDTKGLFLRLKARGKSSDNRQTGRPRTRHTHHTLSGASAAAFRLSLRPRCLLQYRFTRAHKIYLESFLISPGIIHTRSDWWAFLWRRCWRQSTCSCGFRGCIRVTIGSVA